MSTDSGNNFDAVQFGEKLRILRVSQPGSPSLAEFGARIGVSKASLSRYESGDSEPPVSLLERIAAEVGPAAASELLPALARKEVTATLPDHIERAYFTLCEILDLKKATPADVNRSRFARILGKAAQAYAKPGADPEEIRRELVRDVETFLEVVK